MRAAHVPPARPYLRNPTPVANGGRRIAPGMLAWIEPACDWEPNRRAGLDFEIGRPRPREISSRSSNVNAILERRRGMGRIPPVAASIGCIDEWFR
jgi:hypothetical protein